MTLNELFGYLSDHPAYTLGYLVGVPIVAGVLGILAGDRSGMDPWRYLYMILLYMICIPGIFAVTLLIYQFLFGQQSLYDIDLITHVLPIVSMILTIYVIKKYVSLDLIPGFGKITGLILMISTALILFWVVDRTRLVAFTYMPIQYVFLILIGLLLIFRMGLRKVF